MEFSDVEKSLSSVNKDKQDVKDIMLDLVNVGIEQNGKLIQDCFENGIIFYNQDGQVISTNNGRILLFDTPQNNYAQDAPVFYNIKSKSISVIVKNKSYQDIERSLSDNELKNILPLEDNFDYASHIFLSTPAMILDSIKHMQDEADRNKEQIIPFSDFLDEEK